ncbi:hypothetical protein DSO57_1001533 [Entomophthora muscae]|uniref:Uncharacterized protein n=1 Tax=Entomophthora muscae TaxID=34485 RepID=A0ACC2RP72_9FUNG|nr:hypothetical protein DSO57_1001533 [Entomophthora muscae]
MTPIEFLKDRTIFFGLVLVYHTWKQTVGHSHWDVLISKFKDFDLIVYGMLLVSFLLYFVCSAIFAIFDLVIAPSGTTPAERLQPKKPHTWDQYKQAIPLVLFNLLIMTLPTILLLYYFLHPASPATPLALQACIPPFHLHLLF